MGARATFRPTDLEKAIKIAKEAGLPVIGFKITKDGDIDVRCGQQVPGDDFDLTDMRR